jgi:hypothetical protein
MELAVQQVAELGRAISHVCLDPRTSKELAEVTVGSRHCKGVHSISKWAITINMTHCCLTYSEFLAEAAWRTLANSCELPTILPENEDDLLHMDIDEDVWDFLINECSECEYCYELLTC